MEIKKAASQASVQEKLVGNDATWLERVSDEHYHDETLGVATGPTDKETG